MAVTPSIRLSSVAVAVTPSRMLSSAVVAVTPSSIASSVDVTSDTATFPLASVTIALVDVSVSVSIVVADPVIDACFASSAACNPSVLAIVRSPSPIVACLASSCVCILEVTPST